MAVVEEERGLLEGSDNEEKEPQVTTLAERRVNYRRIPVGAWALETAGACDCCPRKSYKLWVYVLTFVCYTTYHLSRKPFSVVKNVLCPKCANGNSSATGWAPFDTDSHHGKTLLGSVDYSFLFAYAIAMYFSGQIGDRVNLRYFLTIGMLGSSISVALLGVAYFAHIHHLAYFIGVQIFGGIMQSTGWPGVVAVMGHWFGKQRRGFLMGLWNVHTSLGNILGTVIPSFWAERGRPWGWAFIVPAAIIGVMGVVIFLFLVTDPADVGLPPPVHHLTIDTVEEESISGPAPRQTLSSEVGVSVEGDHAHSVVDLKEDESEESENEEEREGVIQGGVTDGRMPPGSDGEERRERRRGSARTKAVGFFRALMIPGVIEFSFCLFFNKLVSYTFLFWLPFYVKTTNKDLSDEESDWLSTLFDVGGIFGGIGAGLVSDILNARAVTCVVMLILAIPSLFALRSFGGVDLGLYMALLIVCGLFINGPYAIITTAVSSDLGNHKSLRGNLNAKATVTAIIDGTGSLGAAFGPLVIGWITDDHGWTSAFYFLMGSCFVSALFLSRLVIKETKRWYGTVRFRSYTIL